MSQENQYFEIRHFTWGHIYVFECPGCFIRHQFTVANDDRKPNWTFNNDLVKPTFTPELRNERKRNKRGKLVLKRCYLKIINGQILYSVNCDHILAGRLINMHPLIPEYFNYADTTKCKI
jgi:hypothetical protein